MNWNIFYFIIHWYGHYFQETWCQMLPPIEELGHTKSLSFKTLAKIATICSWPSNSNFFPTCSFFRIWVVISFVNCIFKCSNFFVVCEYYFIVFTMEGNSPDKHHFMLVNLLLGLPLVQGKLHAFNIGEIISYVWLNVWFGVTWSLLSTKIRVWRSGL